MLPNLVIIGGMKCGTTSLHEYLDLHPQICMSRIKEPAFFVKEHNWHKGLDWYRSLFDKQAKVMGESSTSYTKYPKFDEVPEKMHSVIPDAKLIYIVRDPLQRILSQYVHRVSHSGEERSLEEILSDPHNNYVSYSKYYMQIERYVEYYPRERILILDFDEFTKQTQMTLRRVFEFLEVDCDFESELYSVAFNRSKDKRKPNWLGARLRAVRGLSRVYNKLPWGLGPSIEKPVIGDASKQQLISLLKDDVNKFRAFSGCSFAKWCD